jgi:hypothetical protein
MRRGHPSRPSSYPSSPLRPYPSSTPRLWGGTFRRLMLYLEPTCRFSSPPPSSQQAASSSQQPPPSQQPPSRPRASHAPPASKRLRVVSGYVAIREIEFATYLPHLMLLLLRTHLLLVLGLVRLHLLLVIRLPLCHARRELLIVLIVLVLGMPLQHRRGRLTIPRHLSNLLCCDPVLLSQRLQLLLLRLHVGIVVGGIVGGLGGQRFRHQKVAPHCSHCVLRLAHRRREDSAAKAQREHSIASAPPPREKSSQMPYLGICIGWGQDNSSGGGAPISCTHLLRSETHSHLESVEAHY